MITRSRRRPLPASVARRPSGMTWMHRVEFLDHLAKDRLFDAGEFQGRGRRAMQVAHVCHCCLKPTSTGTSGDRSSARWSDMLTPHEVAERWARGAARSVALPGAWG